MMNRKLSEQGGNLISTVKQIVSRIVRTYKTNDPFEIAEHKNITILFNDLGDTFGFFSSYKRFKFIHINSVLDDGMRRYVCAHELGHAVLHPRMNTPFLRSNTFFYTDRLEKEANEFAVELLLPDDVVREYGSIYDAAAACGVPNEVASLKRIDEGLLRTFLRDERSYYSV